jgi:hypothetical protein
MATITKRKVISAYQTAAFENSFLGNKWLYRIGSEEPKNSDWFSAAVWIIGRAYAAPIERRYYGKLLIKNGKNSFGPKLMKNFSSSTRKCC